MSAPHPPSSSIYLRHYRQSDEPTIIELFRLATTGLESGSPYEIAIYDWKSNVHLICIALVLMATGVFLLSGKLYVPIFLVLLAGGLAARRRWEMWQFYNGYFEGCLKEDMRSVYEHYGMATIDDDPLAKPGAPKQASTKNQPVSRQNCFWVAETDVAVGGQGGDEEGTLVVQKQIVGCIGIDTHSIRKPKTRCELRRMMVHPSFRRRGIAGLLVRTLISYAREHGFKSISLGTTSKHDAASTLYEKFGFEIKKKYTVKVMWGLETIDIITYVLEL